MFSRGTIIANERLLHISCGCRLTEPIDFLDIDIQGAELDVVFSCIDAIDELVKLAHIGTHSAQVDARLSHIFHLHGWKPRRIFSCAAVNQTLRAIANRGMDFRRPIVPEDEAQYNKTGHDYCGRR